LFCEDSHATEPAVRGESRTHKTDGIFRANLRGDSTHTRARAEAVAAELLKEDLGVETGKSTLLATRKEVERGWRPPATFYWPKATRTLRPTHIHRFLARMPPPRTEREQPAAALLKRAPAQGDRHTPTR
jgi:hypothetical protein